MQLKSIRNWSTVNTFLKWCKHSEIDVKSTLILYYPCLCCHSFLWWYVVFFSWSKSACFYRLFYVLLLEIKLSRWEGSVSLTGLTPAIFMWLSQARTRISNVIYNGLFCVQWVEVRWEVIVYIGGIDDHHCLNFHNVWLQQK